MAAILQHSIGRQVIDCRLSARGAETHVLQERICRLCRDVLPGVLESALDDCAPAGAVLRVDTLTIDLGRIGLARLETELAERLRARLAETLRRRPASTVPAPEPVADAAPSALEAALIWYLRYGTLPGWCRLTAGSGLADAMLEHWRAAGTADAAALRAALRQALDEAPAEPRLLSQFDGRFRHALLERVHAGAGAWLDEAVAVLVRAVPQAAAAQLRPLVELAALRLALEGDAFDPVRLAADALGRQPPGSPARRILQAFTDRHAPASAPAGSATGDGADHATPASARAARPVAAPPHPDQAGGLAVPHAGIVLLHPFLARLFEALAIAAGERLLLPDRALALLHYLCTGARRAPEHELALAKVLCALPLTAPADGGIALDDAECAEAEALLAAVIGHWSALRNTSPDGLRGAFLLRPGVLRERDGEWHLQVQADTADVLLGSLPWGVSAVRLPWMRGILWVEWG